MAVQGLKVLRRWRRDLVWWWDDYTPAGAAIAAYLLGLVALGALIAATISAIF